MVSTVPNLTEKVITKVSKLYILFSTDTGGITADLYQTKF